MWARPVLVMMVMILVSLGILRKPTRRVKGEHDMIRFLKRL
jgi:hypothetical protein